MNRNLAYLTSPDVAAINKERAIVVLPIASVEQHGPHLPCITDSIIADAVLSRTLDRVSDKADVWTLPLQAYGKSSEHLGFAGTISLDTATLSAICRDVGRSVAASGFRKLVFLNSHGGQPQLLETAARDIREETGLMVFPISLLHIGFPQGILSSEHEAAWGGHGGEGQTSMVLAIDPSVVHMDRALPATDKLYALFGTLKYLSLEGPLPTAWLSRDVAESGAVGDARAATPEKGERILDYMADRLAGALTEIAAFEFGKPAE